VLGNTMFFCWLRNHVYISRQLLYCKYKKLKIDKLLVKFDILQPNHDAIILKKRRREKQSPVHYIYT
jgi:hypothetical protein